jgi:hypothetical protein
MSTVRDLLPGDLVISAPGRPVFITSCPHPVFHHLVLVIWRLPGGSVRLDAMHPGDEVGAVDPIEPAARAERLADALINAEQVMRHGIGLRRRDKPLI